MERALHARDQIGVEDFVLLEDYRSQEAFVDNLRKRFNADLIYVSAASDPPTSDLAPGPESVVDKSMRIAEST
ncbi:Myosin-IB [Amphibalanus amphitrite]|uniref:Myosin-IB n=1 Tax=Amphibalanus amphitrite TaxID=1232801 RepID=A0A6A4VBP5_AMPAM|nr:Myosin-IB [Amphibalanus amphitrite]